MTDQPKISLTDIGKRLATLLTPILQKFIDDELDELEKLTKHEPDMPVSTAAVGIPIASCLGHLVAIIADDLAGDEDKDVARDTMRQEMLEAFDDAATMITDMQEAMQNETKH